MSPFKKTFMIFLVAQFSYWMLAAFAFSKGQLLLQTATAIVAATYITVTLYKKMDRWKWLAILAWAGYVIICYQIIQGWLWFINWTLAEGIIPTTALAYNAMRFIDMVLISAVIVLFLKHTTGIISRRKKTSA